MRDGVAVAFDLEQFAFRDEGVETVGEVAAGGGFDTQFAQQLFVARRFFRLARDVAKDGGVGQHQFSVLSFQLSVFSCQSSAHFSEN